jgi:hypothetical protein
MQGKGILPFSEEKKNHTRKDNGKMISISKKREKDVYFLPIFVQDFMILARLWYAVEIDAPERCAIWHIDVNWLSGVFCRSFAFITSCTQVTIVLNIHISSQTYFSSKFRIWI